MNGLNELVYHVTQQADLLQDIISDPSLLKSYTALSDEQIEAFFEVVNDDQALGNLQNLSQQSYSSNFWRRPWVAPA